MSKITESARNEDCQVRIIGVCNFDPATTVFAHLGGGGIAGKRSDILGAYCCSNCHDIVDGRVKTKIPEMSYRLDFYDGVARTQEMLVNKGLIIIK